MHSTSDLYSTSLTLSDVEGHWGVIPGRPYSTGTFQNTGHRAAIWVIAIRNRAEIWVKSEKKSMTGSILLVPALSLAYGGAANF